MRKDRSQAEGMAAVIALLLVAAACSIPSDENKTDENEAEAAAVTGVTLDVAEKTLTLGAGNSFTLTATVQPENAADKTVSWSSSNTGVAGVDGNGVVTAVAPGTATITVTTANGAKTAACVVTVEPDPDRVIDPALAGRYFISAADARRENGGFTLTAENQRTEYIELLPDGTGRFRLTCAWAERAESTLAANGGYVEFFWPGDTGSFKYTGRNYDLPGSQEYIFSFSVPYGSGDPLVVCCRSIDENGIMHLQIKRDGNDLIRESWLIRAGYDPQTGVITRPPVRFAFRADGDNYNITRCLTLGVDPFDVSPSDWPSEHTGKPVRGVDAYAFSGLRMGTVTLQAALLYSTASFMECDFDTVIVPNGFASFDGGRPIFDSGSIGELRIAAGVSSLSRWNFAMVYTGGSGMFGDSLCAVGSVTVEAGNPYMKVVDEIVYNTAETEILLAPAGITGNKTLPPTLTGDIGSGMFMRCGELTGITISHAVTALGNYAFQHCSKLQWIRFLDASSFDRCFHAFEGCAALEYAVLPDNFHLARNADQYTSPSAPGYTAYPRDYFQEAKLLFTTTSYTAAGTQYNSLNLGASSITRAYYAYSETAPAEETGRYWHYTAAGDPAPW